MSRDAHRELPVAHDEWQVTAERRYLSERSMALVTAKNNDNSKEVAEPELMTA